MKIIILLFKNNEESIIYLLFIKINAPHKPIFKNIPFVFSLSV